MRFHIFVFILQQIIITLIKKSINFIISKTYKIEDTTN